MVSMEPKNWNIGEYSEPRNFSVFGHRIIPKLKKLEGFVPEGEYEESAIKKSE